jgi:hypothetical protein
MSRSYNSSAPIAFVACSRTAYKKLLDQLSDSELFKKDSAA